MIHENLENLVPKYSSMFGIKVNTFSVFPVSKGNSHLRTGKKEWYKVWFDKKYDLTSKARTTYEKESIKSIPVWDRSVIIPKVQDASHSDILDKRERIWSRKVLITHLLYEVLIYRYEKPPQLGGPGKKRNSDIDCWGCSQHKGRDESLTSGVLRQVSVTIEDPLKYFTSWLLFGTWDEVNHCYTRYSSRPQYWSAITIHFIKQSAIFQLNINVSKPHFCNQIVSRPSQWKCAWRGML